MASDALSRETTNDAKNTINLFHELHVNVVSGRARAWIQRLSTLVGYTQPNCRPCCPPHHVWRKKKFIEIFCSEFFFQCRLAQESFPMVAELLGLRASQRHGSHAISVSNAAGTGPAGGTAAAARAGANRICRSNNGKFRRQCSNSTCRCSRRPNSHNVHLPAATAGMVKQFQHRQLNMSG